MDGLFGKYKVEKSDGSPVDPAARYFVLRYDTDPHARLAVWSYAMAVRVDNPQLALDLVNALEPFIEPDEKWRIESARRCIAEAKR